MAGMEYIGAVQDVTERQRSEEALGTAGQNGLTSQGSQVLALLAASIAHEVNQPLSGIINNAGTCLQMLAASPPDIRGAQKLLDVQFAMAIAPRRSLPDYGRYLVRRESKAELVDLNETTQEVVALSLRELQRSRIVLRTELADWLPSVKGDRVQLQQVILNLLLNASRRDELNQRPSKGIDNTNSTQKAIRSALQCKTMGWD